MRRLQADKRDVADPLGIGTAQLRRFADALPTYLAYVDLQDGVMYYRMVNRTYELWLNRPADSMVGHSVEEVLGESFPNVRGHLEEALRGIPQKFDARMSVRNAERWLQVEHIPARDASGVVQGVIVHAHDVTEQHNAKRQLSRSEERLRLALSAANGIGTWDWDVAADVVCSDATFANFYGVPPERAAAGVPIAEFMSGMHPDDRERVGEAIAQAIRTGEEYQSEYRVTAADGTEHWLAAHGRCSYAPDGTPLRFPGVNVDITARKQSEEALIRTEKLAAVGRLASSIAHEINNPLESVVNLLYLIEQTAETDGAETRKYAVLAQSELARVSQIATQTLRFFKQTTQPSDTKVTELLGSVLALYQGRLANSRIQVTTELEGSSSLRCFDGELRQVLNNLVGNAIDAMRLGGHLRIRARRTPAGIVFTVADTGAGMNSETLRRLYEPFFTTKGIMGTGLGLWVSLGIVQKHEGRLRVKSQVGTGTVFRLFVPEMIG